MNVVKEYFNFIQKEADEKSWNEQMTMGKRVEEEHRQTLTRLIKKIKPEISDEDIEAYVLEGISGISEDHIDEFKKYYNFLERMERQMESLGKKNDK